MAQNVRGLPQEAHQEQHLDEGNYSRAECIAPGRASCGKPLLAAGPSCSSRDEYRYSCLVHPEGNGQGNLLGYVIPSRGYPRPLPSTLTYSTEAIPS